MKQLENVVCHSSEPINRLKNDLLKSAIDKVHFSSSIINKFQSQIVNIYVAAAIK